MITTTVPANMGKRSIYRITHSDSLKMSEHAGETINPFAIIITEEDNRKVAFLAVDNDDKTMSVYATNSKTFIQSLECILSIFDNDLDEIGGLYIMAGTSRAGRPFIDCGLAVM